ncbi:MAG: glycosyltransferase family 39 protein, partial [Anaerolineaceae bacterium]|nr:glycosyltransferase family 39 protein [Anaerolineaceae bacterium]
MKKKNWLLAVVFLGTVLRCLFLEDRGIQYDDAFSILLAKEDLPSIIRGTAADTMPPLYYFLLHFWMLVSTKIWWLRFLSVIFSLLGIYFLYKIVRLLLGDHAAIWAVFLAAISPIQIYHAQDVRMYALLQFAQLGYAYCFLRFRT